MLPFLLLVSFPVPWIQIIASHICAYLQDTSHYTLTVLVGWAGTCYIYIYLYLYISESKRYHIHTHAQLYIYICWPYPGSIFTHISTTWYGWQDLPFPGVRLGCCASHPTRCDNALKPGAAARARTAGHPRPFQHWAGPFLSGTPGWHPWFHMGFPINHGISSDFPWGFPKTLETPSSAALGGFQSGVAPNPNPKQVMDGHDDLYSLT